MTSGEGRHGGGNTRRRGERNGRNAGGEKREGKALAEALPCKKNDLILESERNTLISPRLDHKGYHHPTGCVLL